MWMKPMWMKLKVATLYSFTFDKNPGLFKETRSSVIWIFKRQVLQHYSEISDSVRALHIQSVQSCSRQIDSGCGKRWAGQGQLFFQVEVYRKQSSSVPLLGLVWVCVLGTMAHSSCICHLVIKLYWLTDWLYCLANEENVVMHWKGQRCMPKIFMQTLKEISLPFTLRFHWSEQKTLFHSIHTGTDLIPAQDNQKPKWHWKEEHSLKVVCHQHTCGNQSCCSMTSEGRVQWA